MNTEACETKPSCNCCARLETVFAAVAPLGPLLARLYHKHVRIVGLKPNKDLAYMNGLFEAGKLQPVLDGPYALADLPEALRFFGTGDHRGKIIVTLA